MEAGLSQIQSHIIAIIANPKLNHSTYLTIALNELAINPGAFGSNQGNFTVLFMHYVICRYGWGNRGQGAIALLHFFRFVNWGGLASYCVNLGTLSCNTTHIYLDIKADIYSQVKEIINS